MAEKQKKSSSSAGKTKKGRPPPIEVNDPSLITGGGGNSLGLPTMRNMFMPQQIVVTPAAQTWEVQEQTQLERLLRVMCFPSESLLNKSTKIAAYLSNKTIRDVACRLKIMEETSSERTRRPNDIDRALSRTDEIVSELQFFPPSNRSPEQNARLLELMREFINVSRQCKSVLESTNMKIPWQLLALPDLTDKMDKLKQSYPQQQQQQ